MKTYHKTMTEGGIDSYANFIGNVDDIKPFYVLLSRSRDSNLLAESNFDMALEILGGESDHVQIRRFGHWACGWFELILISPDNANILHKAEEIEAALSCYPILNESYYYDRIREAADDLWQDMSIEDRIYSSEQSGVSIFQSRYDNAGDLDEKLYQYLEQLAEE